MGVCHLEYDKDPKDNYDRDLAYVWLSKDVDSNDINDIRNYMFNAKLLDEGYAEIMTIEPNNKYEDEFKKIIND